MPRTCADGPNLREVGTRKRQPNRTPPGTQLGERTQSLFCCQKRLPCRTATSGEEQQQLHHHPMQSSEPNSHNMTGVRDFTHADSAFIVLRGAFTNDDLLGPGALCVGARRSPDLFVVSRPSLMSSLCRGPTLFASKPGVLCRAPAGPSALCVGARRSLCRPALSRRSLRRGPALSVSGPGALPALSVSASGTLSLCVLGPGGPLAALSVSGIVSFTVCVRLQRSPRRAPVLSVSGPGALCVGALCIGLCVRPRCSVPLSSHSLAVCSGLRALSFVSNPKPTHGNKQVGVRLLVEAEDARLLRSYPGMCSEFQQGRTRQHGLLARRAQGRSESEPPVSRAMSMALVQYTHCKMYLYVYVHLHVRARVHVHGLASMEGCGC